MSKLHSVVVFALALGTACPVAAQRTPGSGSSLVERTLNGDFGAPIMRYNALPDELKAVDLTLEGFSGLTDLYGGLAGFGSNFRGSSSDLLQRIATYLGCYWTTGKPIEWHGAEYIIAYRADVPRNLLGYSPDTPAVPGNPLAVQTLRLQVLRVDQIASMTPRPDLTESGWLALVDDSARATAGGDRTTALSNLKQVALASIMYSTDADDVLPNAHSASEAKTALMPYCKNAAIFKTQNPNGGQVLFNVNLAGINTTSIPHPEFVPLFYDSRAWPDGGRPVAFVDGHAKYVSADGWAQVATELARKYKRPAPPAPAKVGKK